MCLNRKPTIFEMLVYDFVREVPKGKVTTYGNVAKGIGRGTARSVGTALSKNPFAPENGEKDEGTVPYVRYEQDL